MKAEFWSARAWRSTVTVFNGGVVSYRRASCFLDYGLGLGPNLQEPTAWLGEPPGATSTFRERASAWCLTDRS